MLDMAIGESSKIESEDKGKIDSIVGKVKELNGRMADIRREQVFQRVSTLFLFGLRFGLLRTIQDLRISFSLRRAAEIVAKRLLTDCFTSTGTRSRIP